MKQINYVIGVQSVKKQTRNLNTKATLSISSNEAPASPEIINGGEQATTSVGNDISLRKWTLHLQ